jgi:2-dehydro-3-deoxygluconokinase
MAARHPPSTGVEVVTLGESLVSLIASPRGPLAEATSFERVVAGAEANVAVGLARLGHRVAYIGRVGDDAFGSVILHRLRGEGVDVRQLLVEAGVPTGIMVRELRDLGPAEVIYHRAGSAGSRLSPAHVDAAADLFTGARWLHVTGITPALSASAAAAVDTALKRARDAGLTISLDLNIRRKLWPEARAATVLGALLRRVDVVLGGLDEAALVGGLATSLEGGSGVDPERAAAALLRLGPVTAVIKLGASGALELGRDGTVVRHAGVRVARAIDPVGAGDGFSAGYIAARLEGLGAGAALALGNACGAAVVATVGDLTGLPSRVEAERLLAAEGPDQLR